MVNCPKCDAVLHEGSRRCPLCGTPISLLGFRPDPKRKADPVVDPMLSLFERDEVVRYCPECVNEFIDSQKSCRFCRVTLHRARRTDYERDLLSRPLTELGTLVAEGPPRVPPDLVRVKVCQGLEEAQRCLEELRFVGLEPVSGSDSLDPFDEPEAIGIYVRAADREAATFLITGLKARDPMLDPPGREPVSTLERVRALGALGKFKDALRLIAQEDASAEMRTLEADLLLRCGRVRTAQRRALEAGADDHLPDRARGALLAQAGLFLALGHDGTPFGEGADSAGAAAVLEEATELAPRLLRAGKVRAEVLQSMGSKPLLRKEMRRLERVCPNLIARDGVWRRWFFGFVGDFSA